MISILSSGGSSNPWMYEMFTAIRTGAIESSSAFTSLALVCACIITIFLTIRTASHLMSDEQQSGFGGVTLWELLRPLVIILLICEFPTVIKCLDGVCNGISMAVMNSIPSASADAVVAEAGKADEAVDNAANPIVLAIINDRGYATYEDWVNGIKTTPAGKTVDMDSDIFTRLSYAGDSKISLKDYAEKIHQQKLENGADPEETTFRSVLKDLRTYMRASNQKWDDETGDFVEADRSGLFNLGGISFPDITRFFYNWFFLIVMAGAEMMLCIMAVLGPWALVVSLLPPMKNAFVDYLGRYVQISFWKVVGAVINWVVETAIISGKNWSASLLQDKLSPEASGLSGLLDTAISYSGVKMMVAFISIAGIMLLFKVPSIAGAIIPAANASDGSGAAGGVAGGLATSTMNAPKSVAGGAKDMVQTIAGFKGLKK